uniref:Uncharacterized protein n=1 Tax=Ignisphaera aggregans TaxID=334771 RepID=A0A7J3QEM2_9CREN
MRYIQIFEYESLFKKLIYIDTDNIDTCSLLSVKYLDIKFICKSGSYLESSIVSSKFDPSIAFLYRFYIRCLSGYRICIAITKNEKVLELAKNAIENDDLRPLVKKFRSSNLGIIIIAKVLNNYNETIEEMVSIIKGIEKTFMKIHRLLFYSEDINKPKYSDLYSEINEIPQWF